MAGSGPKYKATVDGGIPLGKASNLVQTMDFAKPLLRQGKRVYVRDTSQPGTVATFVGFPAEVTTTNALGEQRPNPDWVGKALNFLSL